MVKQKAQEETRTAQVNIAVTPSEKAAIKLIAAFDEKTESDLLYPFVAQIAERAARLRRSMTEAA